LDAAFADPASHDVSQVAAQVLVSAREKKVEAVDEVFKPGYYFVDVSNYPKTLSSPGFYGGTPRFRIVTKVHDEIAKVATPVRVTRQS
jgi:hypothetical protein